MSRNNTLLSRLGFADNDKRHELHDLGCEYLALPGNAQRLAEILWPGWEVVAFQCPEGEHPDSYEEDRDRSLDKVIPGTAWLKTHTEIPISKGHDQYKQTIGFADLTLVANAGWPSEDGWAATWSQKNARSHSALVEVKAGAVNVHDAIRQLRLYAEHRPADLVLATVEPVDAVGKASLKREGILHIRLAQPFHDWVASRHELEAAPDIEF